MNPNDDKSREGTRPSGKPPTRFMKRPDQQPSPDKDWYRKWQEGLQQHEKEDSR